MPKTTLLRVVPLTGGSPARAPLLASSIAAVRTARPKLLDQVREAIRTRHYSHRTEEAYVAWIRRFILFHRKRHPIAMGEPAIEQFLTALAVTGGMAASTQNQALAALLFLYKNVLELDPGWVDEVVRAKRPQRLPTVLTRSEVEAIAARRRKCARGSPVLTRKREGLTESDPAPAR